MILWTAKKVLKAVSVEQVTSIDGKDFDYRPPTSDIGFRAQEPDGTEVVLISHGDSFDLVYGKDPSYFAVPVSPKAAMKMAWFVLWKWWFRGTWMGWKLRAWYWATSVILEEQAYEQQRRRRQARNQATPGPASRYIR